jgi:hypothetical protein
MNKRTAFIVQLIGELVIPLLGYFLWDWSLLFILLFYLIENLFFSYFRIETVREVKKTVWKNEQPRELKIFSKSLTIWTIEFVLVHLFIAVIYPNQSFIKEWVDFFMYQDLGIPQGIILLPLIYISSRMKMKQDVMLNIRNLKSVEELNHMTVSFKHSWISIGIWGILIGINFFIPIHELINLSFVLILLIARSFQRN